MCGLILDGMGWTTALSLGFCSLLWLVGFFILNGWTVLGVTPSPTPPPPNCLPLHTPPHTHTPALPAPATHTCLFTCHHDLSLSLHFLFHFCVPLHTCPTSDIVPHTWISSSHSMPRVSNISQQRKRKEENPSCLPALVLTPILPFALVVCLWEQELFPGKRPTPN